MLSPEIEIAADGRGKPHASVFVKISYADKVRLWGRMLAFGLIVLGVIRLLPTLSVENIHNDFSHYYIGGSLYGAGENAYTEHLQAHCERLGFPYDPTIPFAAHPPLILGWFSLLALLPIKAAYGVWLAIQVACLVGCLELTRRILRCRWSDPRWLITVGVFINAYSVQTLFYYSQIQLAVAGLIYAALLLHLKGRGTAACAVITFASALKIYPVILAPWFLFRSSGGRIDYPRRLAAMGGMSIVCLLLPGFSTWIEFAVHGVPALAANAAKWCNFSMQNFVLMVDRVGLAADAPSSEARRMAAMLAIGAIGLVYILAWRRASKPVVACSLLLCCMVFAGMITWAHYMTLMFLPVALAWKMAADEQNAALKMLAFVAGAAVLMPQLDCRFWSAELSYARVLIHFYPLAAAIVLVIVLMRLRSANRCSWTEPGRRTNENFTL